MTPYLCVRQKRDARGILRDDGEPFTVFVTVNTPRYVKRGHSFVTVYRQDGDGPKTCLFPAQEVPSTGSRAARAFLASMGWAVQNTTVTRCRVPRKFRASRASHHPHKPLSADSTLAVDEMFQAGPGRRGVEDEDLSW